MAQNRFVTYYRVSTARQGVSGLGLDGQREAVRVFLSNGGWPQVGEFTDVESGKHDDRPQLQKAMGMARLTGATLLIAKLDRLSRDAHFLLGLEKAGIEFIACDMPNANRLTVRLMAVIAQEEREMIAARTKTALAAAKARGRTLGGWRGGPKVNSSLGREAQRRQADRFAASVLPLVRVRQREGLSLRAIAATLNSNCIMTVCVRSAHRRLSREDGRERLSCETIANDGDYSQRGVFGAPLIPIPMGLAIDPLEATS